MGIPRTEKSDSVNDQQALTYFDNILNLKYLSDVARLLFWQASKAAIYGEVAMMNRRPMHLSAADCGPRTAAPAG